MRTCLDCDTGITARSKSGRCQPCSARAFMSERGARAMWANWRAARVARLEAEIAERMDALAALRR